MKNKVVSSKIPKLNISPNSAKIQSPGLKRKDCEYFKNKTPKRQSRSGF